MMAGTVQSQPVAERQLDRNQAAYEAIRAEMEDRHMGRVALMHNGAVVEVYNDGGDAYKIGCEKYGLGNFSLVNIGEQPISLGFFTMFVEPREE